MKITYTVLTWYYRFLVFWYSFLFLYALNLLNSSIKKIHAKIFLALENFGMLYSTTKMCVLPLAVELEAPVSIFVE